MECKVNSKIDKISKPSRLNRNIVECKEQSNTGKEVLKQRLNRNIVECKVQEKCRLGSLFDD